MKLFKTLTVFSIATFALAVASRAESANGKVRTTAYTHTESDHVEYGRKTASGSTLKYTKGYTSAAADWSKFPLGTKFKIKGLDTTFVVDDYGSALVGTETIDIYHPSRSAMNNWGVRHVDIKVIEKGDLEKSREILADRKGYSHVREMLASIDKEQKSSAKGGWFFRNREEKPAPAPEPKPTPEPAPSKQPAVLMASAPPAPKPAAEPKPKAAPAPEPKPAAKPEPKPAPASVMVAEVPAPSVAPATVPAVVTPPAPVPVPEPNARKVRPLEVIEVASADQPESIVVLTEPAPIAEPKKRAFRPL